MTLSKTDVLSKADMYCRMNGLTLATAVSDVEVYFIEPEILIAKPVDKDEASFYDGLYGDMATMPKVFLIYLRDQDRFETTEYTDKYLKKAS